MSYTDRLAAISSSFEETLRDVYAFAKEIDEGEARVLKNWHYMTGAYIKGLHAMVLRVEKGETILVRCTSCGHFLDLFDLWDDEALCAACRGIEDDSDPSEWEDTSL